MAQQSTTHTLRGGFTLVRRYNDSYHPGPQSADRQCGSLAQWDTWLTQMLVGQGYYQVRTRHKFLEKVTLESVSPFVSFPYHQSLPGVLAYCAPLGNARSRVVIRYFTAEGADPYKFEGGMSHEMGHAYHNWCGCFDLAARIRPEFERFWARQISVNGTTYDPTKAPWNKDGMGEQFANAQRCYLGVASTRGSSQAYPAPPGSRDPVVEGFKDPNVNQGWCTQMKLLPETCAMVESYGIKPGSLRWPYGDFGGWVFEIEQGHTVLHWFDNNNLARWYWLNGNTWEPWGSITYQRS